MRLHPLPVALAAILIGGAPAPAAAQLTGAPASTMTTNPDKPAAPPPHRRPTAHHLRELDAARIRSLAPRPPLNIDCTPAQERAARSDLEQAQYRLKCGR